MSTTDNKWPCTVKGCTRNNRACMSMIGIESSKEPSEEVKFLETGLGTMCEEAVQYFNAELTRHESRQNVVDSANNTDSTKMTPSKLAAEIQDYVRGQDKAVEVLASATIKFITNRDLRNNPELLKKYGLDENKLRKPVVMLPGSTGSGKTYIGDLMAGVLGLPMVKKSVTGMSQAGYVGKSVDEIVDAIFDSASDFLTKKKGREPAPEEVAEFIKTEGMICLLDEIDKIAAGKSGSQDVGGEKVQDELLTMIQGDVYEVSVGGGPMAQKVRIDTSNVMFMLAGAFQPAKSGKEAKPWLTEIIKKRINGGSGGSGLSSSGGAGNAESAKLKDEQDRHIYHYVTDDDFVEFGMKPEFIGRVTAIAPFSKLSRDILLEIMTEAKNSVVGQSMAYYEQLGFELAFEQKALERIADLAATSDTGARSISKAVDRVLEKVDFLVHDKAGEYNTIYISEEMVSPDPSKVGIIVEKGDRKSVV